MVVTAAAARRRRTSWCRAWGSVTGEPTSGWSPTAHVYNSSHFLRQSFTIGIFDLFVFTVENCTPCCPDLSIRKMYVEIRFTADWSSLISEVISFKLQIKTKGLFCVRYLISFWLESSPYCLTSYCTQHLQAPCCFVLFALDVEAMIGCFNRQATVYS